MAKKKICFCVSCWEDTVHEKVCAETQGAERVFLALVTAGFSEIGMEYDWACSKCGKITRD